MIENYSQAYFSGGESLAALGDAFIMSPIVHKISKDYDKVYFPARHSNYETVKCLFQDNSRVEVFSYVFPYVIHEDIENIKKWLADKDCVRINPPDITITKLHIPGIDIPVPVAINWDRQLYEYYDMTISSRYSEFKLPKYIDGSSELFDQLTNGDTNYCLLHQQTSLHSHGMIELHLHNWRLQYNLPPMKIIEITPEITKNMLQYVKLIENAKEIHCVPSSFFCLVDSIYERTSANLFLHDIRADTLMQINSKWNNNRWNIVKYDRKL
jgi:hypothetical protein